MTLWIILTLMAAIAAAVLTVPLVRRQEARADARTATLAVLRDQLADVDVQLAAGTLAPADAEGMRTEIKRRMLAAGHVPVEAEHPLGARGLGRLAVGLAAVVGLAASAMYASMGRPDLGGIAAASIPGSAPQAGAAKPAAPAATPEIAMLITGLERKMAANPADPQGWQMLGWSYFQTARYPEAAAAYAKAVALKGDGPGYQSAYGEALVQAANGTVTPAAAAAFKAAAGLDANDARARYYLGLAKAQGGQPQAAIDDWLALVAASPGDAPWLPQLRQSITETAAAAKIDVSARLAGVVPSGSASVAPPPGLPVDGSGEAPSAAMARGPDAAQVAGAAAMTPADRQAMIGGMVDRLAAKLKANPRDEDGWVRLMRARQVMGDASGAAAARTEALAAFATDSAAQARLRAAADGMGVK